MTDSKNEVADNATINGAPSPESPGRLSTEAVHSAYGGAQDKSKLLAPDPDGTIGTWNGPQSPNDEMTVTVMVRCKASDAEIDRTLKQIVNHERKPLTDAEFNARFGADPGALSRVEEFAKDNGLTIDSVNPEAGQVVLKGRARVFDKIFGLDTMDFQPRVKGLGGDHPDQGSFLGGIQMPADIAKDVQGVLGLNNRVIAKSDITSTSSGLEGSDASQGYMPNEVADAYDFPKSSMGSGQSTGIIELEGGFDPADNAQYYKDHHLPVPKIQLVTIDGAKSDPGQSPSDGEVALNSQVLGAVAPGANQQIIFAPNNTQGFVDAITRASFPEKGEMQNSAISISWGGPESHWSKADIQSLDAALKKAALKGISVLAAAGDAGASDGSPDGSYHTVFPASDPYVTGCGGTELYIGVNGANEEVVWNDGSDALGATGGGISDIFDVPDFQKGLVMPPNMNHKGKETGRGSPDIAGDAAPKTGYKSRYWGGEYSAGGTSAVAPLYAGLVMRINGALGHPVGDLNPFLYKNADKGIFTDITLGDNNGYKVHPGWNAATGWGSIKGSKLLEQYQIQDKKGP